MIQTDKKVSAILLAAGKSKRFEQDKTFFEIDGTPIAIKSLETLLELKILKNIFIVSSDENYENFKNYLINSKYSNKIEIIIGSTSRSASLINAVKFIKKNNIDFDYLIIHDAARPYASKKLFQKGVDLLEKYDAVIPGLTPTDTVKVVDKSDFISRTLDRAELVNVQTPQFFNKKIFFEKIENIIPSEKYTDDSSLLDNTSINIKLMPGEIKNKKITTKNDVSQNSIFYGTGFDIHKLVEGKNLRIGSINIDYPLKLKGHSDGDVLIHSIIDSILGAASMGDIGKFFPSSNDSLKNIDSTVMLKKVIDMIAVKGFEIIHLDNTIIAQKPRMTDYIENMKLNLSTILKIHKKQINIKSTTTDFIGIIGSEKAIASQSICSLKKIK